MPLVQLRYWIVLKDIMENNASLKPVKASTSKPNNNPPSWDKTLGIDPDTCFYEKEDCDNTD